MAASLVISYLPLVIACSTPAPQSKPHAQNLLLITIDTLRADHVGAYGYARARTPALDGLARGVRFEHAYAAAPITLPSHATILTGRYPPGHGSRDNGFPVSPNVPTLATELHARGFRTAAFVAAFPLDHQFGLNRSFDVYSDRLPRDQAGRQANERPASAVISEAIAWLGTLPAHPAPPAPPAPFFLWVHLFEPHAPYGDETTRPVLDRYDDEIATADSEIGRLLNALGERLAQTVIIATGDHGEAFGEHGEYAHSIFVYDTTLRVPLMMQIPGVTGRVISDPVTLADIAPTAARLLGAELKDVDGIDLAPAFAGTRLAARELYAESFAPLVEFGWAPLRSIRSTAWKLIAAPKPELFDIGQDPSELTNVAASQPTVVRTLGARANRYSPASLPTVASANAEAAERLRALGYSSGINNQPSTINNLPDPKERRELAARIAQVTSGELSGDALLSALEGIVREDPRNGQAHLRLGYARLQAGDCARATPHFQAAIAGGIPAAESYLGIATCLGRANDLAGAERALAEARRLEPDNPVIVANVGILQATRGDNRAALQSLQAALASDTNLHEARFNLALVYARLGRRAEAAATARDLLSRLPPAAPQRAEVQRLLNSLQ